MKLSRNPKRVTVNGELHEFYALDTGPAGAVPVMHLDLPLPPSANACWRNGKGGRGRYRTDVYKRWIADAKMLAIASLPVPAPVFAPGYSVKVSVGMNRLRDLDNIAKPIIDTLVVALGLPDDRWCDRIELDREGPMGRAYVTIIGGGL